MAPGMRASVRPCQKNQRRKYARRRRDSGTKWTSQLEPLAFDLRSDLSVFQVFARFASSPVATNEQVNDAKKILSGGVSVLTGEVEATAAI